MMTGHRVLELGVRKNSQGYSRALSLCARCFTTNPSKFHYIFNLRDLSRVFEGMSQSCADSIASEIAFVRLWRNEVLRVFHDRLVDANDRSLVKQKIGSLVIDYFDSDEKISKHAL